VTYTDELDDELACDDMYLGVTEPTTGCTSSTVIGDNSGVYLGGLPFDFVIHQQDSDPRQKVAVSIRAFSPLFDNRPTYFTFFRFPEMLLFMFFKNSFIQSFIIKKTHNKRVCTITTDQWKYASAPESEQ